MELNEPKIGVAAGLSKAVDVDSRLFLNESPEQSSAWKGMAVIML